MINCLAQAIVAVFTYIQTGSSNLISLALSGGGFAATGAGAYLVFNHVRLFWYNYDPNGEMATQPFNWLANDSDSGGVADLITNASKETDNAIENALTF